MEIGKAMERKIHVDANAWRFCEILLDIELGCDNKSRLCCVLFRSDATSSKKKSFSTRDNGKGKKLDKRRRRRRGGKSICKGNLNVITLGFRCEEGKKCDIK